MAGQIINRGPKTWMVRVFTGRDENGKRKYINKTIHGTKKDAQAWLNKALSDLDVGAFVEPTKETTNAYFDKWLETVVKQRVQPRTYADYKEIVQRYIRPVLGDQKLINISPSVIQKLYADLLDNGLSASTVRKLHNVLHSAFKQSERWKMISRNPVGLVDPPRLQKKEMQVFSPVQVLSFLEKAKGNKWYAFFLLAIDSGMRPSEILALRWEDINFITETISVKRTLANDRKKAYIAEPKTKGSKRTIKVSAGTLQVLKTHRKKQAADRLAYGAGYEDNGLVFACEKGSFLDGHNLLNRHFKPILKQAGLPLNIRLYDLRHTCATLLLSAGINPKVVAERLGHASVTLTLDTYSHVLPTMQEDAASKLESMLFK